MVIKANCLIICYLSIPSSKTKQYQIIFFFYFYTKIALQKTYYYFFFKNHASNLKTHALNINKGITPNRTVKKDCLGLMKYKIVLS